MTIRLKSLGITMKYTGNRRAFLETNLKHREPFGLLNEWFEKACATKEIIQPYVMCLSTISQDGYPSARYILCKGYNEEGFRFVTNYESRKAKEMDSNPNVAATFYWDVLHRSVCVRGTVEKLSQDESIKLFKTRPVPNRISACVSFQSTPIESRDVLSERKSVMEAIYMATGGEVAKPDYWGGYVIRPRHLEFCQVQPNSTFDIIKFRKPKKDELPDGKILHESENGWVFERLSC